VCVCRGTGLAGVSTALVPLSTVGQRAVDGADVTAWHSLQANTTLFHVVELTCSRSAASSLVVLVRRTHLFFSATPAPLVLVCHEHYNKLYSL